MSNIYNPFAQSSSGGSSSINFPTLRDFVAYYQGTSQTVSNNTWTRINFDTVEEAGAGNVTTGASWNYAVNQSGVAEITTAVLYNAATWPNNSIWELGVSRVAGATAPEILIDKNMSDAAANSSKNHGVQGTIDLPVSSGDEISIWTRQITGANRSILNQQLYSYVNIGLSDYD